MSDTMNLLQPGEILDSFRIGRELHASAVATLYQAEDIVSGNSVVLKIPLNDLINNPILLYHHQNESRIGKLLDNPHVVRFLHRHKSHQYSIIEYIDGLDLREHLSRKKKFDLDEAINIFCQIAEGCDYLHSINIIHLDIKPENIMITKGGKVKIIDFGLSHDLKYGDYLGLDFAKPKGTPYYISPEQLCDLRHFKQSDIYCLGMVFYEMLTGKLPFDKSTSLTKVSERLKIDPVPPRYYNKSIPPSIQDIILRCLEKNPDNRPHSLTDCIEKVKNYQNFPSGRYGDLITRPIAFLSYFDSFDIAKIKNSQPQIYEETHSQTFKQILGCVADHDSSNTVIDWLKRETVGSTSVLTLLHVIEKTDDNDFEKYSQEIDGARLAKRLDQYLTYLNRYEIYPLLRIKRGNAAEIITEMARELPADIIVIGRPRKRSFISKIITGSVMGKIVDAELTNVIVAQAVKNVPSPPHTKLSSFTHKEIHNLELFFLECWAEHADLLINMELLQEKDTASIRNGSELCNLAQWLLQLLNSSGGTKDIESLFNLDSKYHQYLSELNRPFIEKEYVKAVDLYDHKLYPLLREMKNNIHSLMLKIKADIIMKKGQCT